LKAKTSRGFHAFLHTLGWKSIAQVAREMVRIIKKRSWLVRTVLVLLASFCVWTKSLVCKDAVNRDFTIQNTLKRLCTAFKTEDFQFLVSRPDDRAIPSGRPFVHCSIRSNDVPFRPDARQNKHHPSGRRIFPSGPSLFHEATVPACIRPDVSAACSDTSQ
jgi:hypothetical protein